MTRRKTFSWALTAFALAMAIAPTPGALAQDPSRLSQLRISVWPEYDKPTVLVLIDGTLADPSNLPREVSVLIPSRASLLATTWQNADGSLAPEQSAKSTDLGDGYARVTWTVRTAQYHLEYYDDVLRGTPDKTMDVSVKTIAPVDQVSLEIQQPLQATNFSVTPAPSTTRTDNMGFKYYVFPTASLAAGQTITVQAKYTKADPSPSVQALPPQLPETAPPPAATSSPWSNIFVLVALVVLGLTAVVGLFLLQRRSREESPVRTMPPDSRRGSRRAAPSSASGFCTQCGYAMGPADNFCPRCGTKRREVG